MKRQRSLFDSFTPVKKQRYVDDNESVQGAASSSGNDDDTSSSLLPTGRYKVELPIIDLAFTKHLLVILFTEL